MKSLLVLLVLVSASAHAYSPEYKLTVTADKTVRLTVVGDESGSFSACKYSMSWFEGLNFKKYWGHFNLDAGDVKNFEVKNDIATKIQHPTASVECEYIDG